MGKRALLLGAGFSFDLGMPLVNTLTQDFFHFLTPERMEKYIKSWKLAEPYGADRPLNPKSMDEVFEIYLKHRSNSESNYENFLKEIQDRYHELGAKQDHKDTMHFAFGRFLEILFHMFWMYQSNNFAIYMLNKRFYDSFFDLMGNNKELWGLTLNHDLLIEFLCLDNRIPISFGGTEEVYFPLSNKNMNEIVSFWSIPRRNMKLETMDFIKGSSGVNLIKLHGAINEFSYNDDKNVLHIKPEQNETASSYIQRVKKVLYDMHYYINDVPMKVCNEIVVSDLEGKAQFLRTSLLTGGYKYSETFDPKPGEEKIHLMEEVLAQVDELVIIGYGFGYNHVNLRLYNAMLLNKDLTVKIIDPFRTKVPDILKPFDYKMRIRLYKCGAPEGLTYLVTGKWDKEQLEVLKDIRRKRSTYDKEFRERFLYEK